MGRIFPFGPFLFIYFFLFLFFFNFHSSNFYLLNVSYHAKFEKKIYSLYSDLSFGNFGPQLGPNRTSGFKNFTPVIFIDSF